MPRITTRNFLNIFARAGIGLKSSVPKVSDEIQLVTIVDDFSDHLGVGGAVNQSLYAAQARGVVTSGNNHGALECEVTNPNGIIIDNVQKPNAGSQLDAGSFHIYVLDGPETLVNRNVRNPLLISTVGAVPRTIVTIAEITEAVLFDGHVSGNYEVNVTQMSDLLRGFPVSQGSFLMLVDVSRGNTVLAIQWHEIPDNPVSA